MVFLSLTYFKIWDIEVKINKQICENHKISCLASDNNGQIYAAASDSIIKLDDYQKFNSGQNFYSDTCMAISSETNKIYLGDYNSIAVYVRENKIKTLQEHTEAITCLLIH